MLPRKAAQRVRLSAKADSGRIVGSIGDLGINSFQLGKTITAGEGGAVTTSDPVLYERAFRFHDVGIVSRSFNATVGQGVLGAFASCNFRMNEFTGAVMKGQVQKLDTICQALRAKAKKVREGIADLPGLKLGKSADVEGDLGTTVFLDTDYAHRRVASLPVVPRGPVKLGSGCPRRPPRGRGSKRSGRPRRYRGRRAWRGCPARSLAPPRTSPGRCRYTL